MNVDPLPDQTPSERRLGKRESGERSAWQAKAGTLEVVVADDDESSRELIGYAIGRLGHNVRLAVDGNDALRVLRERPADLVVSDWDMPGMNGAELCRRVRAAGDDAPYTYFIIMTAFDDRDHLIAGMAAGADDYQRKPVNLDELEARLVSAGRVVDLHRRLASRTAELRDDTTRLYAASRTDALTGAGNRLRLDDEIATLLSRAQRYGHRCSLAICDLDFFKAFNDQFGHVAGDAVLRQLATAILPKLRRDDIFARVGGEEFAILLPELDAAAAQATGERVRKIVEDSKFSFDSVPIPCTVSCGIAHLDETTSAPADLYRTADSALYRAKQEGRNCVRS